MPHERRTVWLPPEQIAKVSVGETLADPVNTHHVEPWSPGCIGWRVLSVDRRVIQRNPELDRAFGREDISAFKLGSSVTIERMF